MPKTRQTWREKLHKEMEPKVVDTPRGRLLVPKPLDVDAKMRKVKKGKLVTMRELRRSLAQDFGADDACPMTTGIMIRIAAEVAEEDLKEGRKRITPYWRVLRNDGTLNPKYPGGVQRQADYLTAEGYLIERTGKKKLPRVGDFEKRLQRL
jgi:alkylated DNA nucleotide flippase Atl1